MIARRVDQELLLALKKSGNPFFLLHFKLLVTYDPEGFWFAFSELLLHKPN